MNTLLNLILRDATSDDHPAAVRVLAGAFQTSPIACWAERDDNMRAVALRQYFAGVVSHAGRHGLVRVATEGDSVVGVAVWYSHRACRTAVTAHPQFGGGCGDLVPDCWHRLSGLDRRLQGRHPHAAHEYLMYLGVTPDGQNQGIGTALVRERLGTLRITGMPVYLEAKDLRSQALFERIGFTVHGGPVTGHGGPAVQPMWWQPSP